MDARFDNAHPPAEDLSAYADGDLDEGRRGPVADHLAGCPACREILEGLGSLRSSLSGLMAVEPERDLWPEIRRQRRAEVAPASALSGVRAWWQNLWLLPGMAVAGAAAALLLVWWLGGLGPRGTGEVSGPKSALTAVADAEAAYREAIAGLDLALAERRAGMEPEVRREIDEGLAGVDAAVERCREALRRNPGDLAAHQAVLAAYGHKVEFLEELVYRPEP